MDSLRFLCARRVVTQCPLPALPDDLYPVLFQAAFQDGRPLALQDLVATWPFPELNFLQLVGDLELRGDHPDIECNQAIIQGVVAQLRRELEEPGRQSSGCQLRVLDMTGVCDSLSSHTPDGWTFGSSTKALAEACVEVSRHQQQFQRCGSRRHKGCSGATTAEAAPQHPGVDVHADLVVNTESYEILRDALQIGAAGPLRLKCRKFEPKFISAFQIVTLLECLDPSCLRRVKLCSLGLNGLLAILPHLTRFPELRGLKLWDITMDVQHPTPESAMRIRCVAGQLGMLPSLRELSLGSSQFPGNLHQILGNLDISSSHQSSLGPHLFLFPPASDLKAPLESLGLAFCSLVPADLAFLSQSFHTPALRRLDLSGLNISQDLLEPLRLLLEETSASLLQLDLSYCHVSDSHLAALLPTLLRCSRLRVLGLYGNPLSTAALKDLLQKTLQLPDLHVVVYPIPLDCHTLDPSEFDCDFFDEHVDEALLSAATAEISQLLANSGRTDLVWTDDPDHEDLDYFSL